MIIKETKLKISRLSHISCHIFFWFNTLKGTVKAPAVDLLSLNTRGGIGHDTISTPILFITRILPPRSSSKTFWEAYGLHVIDRSLYL